MAEMKVKILVDSLMVVLLKPAGGRNLPRAA